MEKLKKRIIIIASISIIFSIIVLIGYFGSKNKPATKNLIEESRESDENTPLPIVGDNKQGSLTQGQSSSIFQNTEKNIYKPLFDQRFLYLNFDYPNLYLYDYSDEVIKVINLKDDVYKEIYRIGGLRNAFFSPDNSKIIIDNGQLSFLDLKTDKLFNLPSSVKNFVFTNKDLVVYFNNNKNFSYLAYFKDGEIIKIRNLGILEPEFIFTPDNKILIYQSKISAPVFSLNLDFPSPSLSVFLEEANNYSLLLEKQDKKLLFISNEEGSKIINVDNKETIFSFNWQTIKEKCSFDKVLVCAIPSNFDVNNWHLFGESYDEKIIIFDPQKKEVIKEINLNTKFDILNPFLFDSKLIFVNRIDSKIYSLKVD